MLYSRGIICRVISVLQSRVLERRLSGCEVYLQTNRSQKWLLHTNVGSRCVLQSRQPFKEQVNSVFYSYYCVTFNQRSISILPTPILRFLKLECLETIIISLFLCKTTPLSIQHIKLRISLKKIVFRLPISLLTHQTLTLLNMYSMGLKSQYLKCSQKL